MSDKQLHQIIAIEKGVKSRVYGEISKLHNVVQKPDLFNGMVRTYKPTSDQGENLPQETKRVQFNCTDILEFVASLSTQAYDVEASKDWTNCRARADVVVDGKKLIEGAPATYLLFLEKQLSDLHAFLAAMPTLDEAEEWSADPNAPIFRAKDAMTHRTRKVQRPIVLYAATDKHPAQTQLITEDVVDGHWHIQKTSGAMPIPRQKALIRKVEKLSDAVKMARERANAVNVEEPKVGGAIFAFLFE